MTESDVKIICCVENSGGFRDYYTIFDVEGFEVMSHLEHEPTVRFLFNLYLKYVEYVPDKALRKMTGKLFHIELFSAYKTYMAICLTLKIMANDPGTVFLPPRLWAADFERHTYSRAFLETLLEDLTQCGETESALIVVRKLSEMDSDGGRFVL